jgi:hypothetical protein
MGDSPFHFFFLFLVLFFFGILNILRLHIYVNILYGCSLYCQRITLPLKGQKEAEAGSAEVQPVRNTFGI